MLYLDFILQITTRGNTIGGVTTGGLNTPIEFWLVLLMLVVSVIEYFRNSG